MLLAIADVLTAAEVTQVRESLAQMAFEDGRVTAGWNARLVNKNHQASASAALDKLRASVSAAILRRC
jgi:predicted 2-oxoglutarate/Fe(II)-dependent dioxygenase YbiX